MTTTQTPRLDISGGYDLDKVKAAHAARDAADAAHDRISHLGSTDTLRPHWCACGRCFRTTRGLHAHQAAERRKARVIFNDALLAAKVGG